MHTIKTRHNPISIEPARLKSSDSIDNEENNPLSKTSPGKFAPKNFMNMKLLGKAHQQLETSIISGSNRVKLNIGKISGANEKILQSI